MTLPAGLQAFARPTALARLKDAAARGLRYAPTEARRNRVLYAGWPLIILASLPFSAVLAAAVGLPWGQGVSGALTAWGVIGLPLTALVFGSVAGAGLRGPAEEADAPLPVSSLQRVSGALAGAAGAFTADAALVALLVAAWSPDARDILFSLLRMGKWGGVASVLPAALAATAATAWLMTTAFTAAYASGNAVLGAVAAVFGAGAVLLPVLSAAALFLHHAPHLAGPFEAIAVALTAASCAGAFGALAVAAPAIARRRGMSWLRAATLCLLPLAGSLGSWPTLWHAALKVQKHLERAPREFDQKDFMDRDDEKRRAGLGIGVGGRLVLEDSRGRVELLSGTDPTAAELALSPFDGLERVTSAFRDKEDVIWAEISMPQRGTEPTLRVIYSGDGRGPLKHYMTLPSGSKLTLYGGRAAIDITPSVVTDRDFIPLDSAKPPLPKRQ